MVEQDVPLHILWWNDPDPIPGNDYRVFHISNIDEEAGTCLIQYGEGSEAQIFINELSFDYKQRQLNLM